MLSRSRSSCTRRFGLCSILLVAVGAMLPLATAGASEQAASGSVVSAAEQVPVAEVTRHFRAMAAALPAVQGTLRDERQGNVNHVLLDSADRFAVDIIAPVRAGRRGPGEVVQAMASNGRVTWDYRELNGGYEERPVNPAPFTRWQWFRSPWPLLGRMAEMIESDPGSSAERSANGEVVLSSPMFGWRFRLDEQWRLMELRIESIEAEPHRMPWQTVGFEQYQREPNWPLDLPMLVTQVYSANGPHPERHMTYAVVEWNPAPTTEEIERAVNFDRKRYGDPKPRTINVRVLSQEEWDKKVTRKGETRPKAEDGAAVPAGVPGASGGVWYRSPLAWAGAFGVTLTLWVVLRLLRR
jgi:hypothetical protein